ncbi:hypothetical protein HY086_03910 [Candidatus Gottesmanbacteria bacterium]|nr:hypothetical protein [Candidatus Gottesmanbacteria bacterium]
MNKALAQCAKATDSTEKKQCWQFEVEKFLGRGDIAGSLTLIASFFDKDPSLSETCHGLTHTIGKHAFALFAKGESFALNEKTTYCSYGFFHGFMEALIQHGSNISVAQQFCDRIGEKLAKTSPDARYACFHGIGHGWTNVHDPRLYGNERAMVGPALALCQRVARQKEELLRCATGVFDSISISYYNKQYGLTMKRGDPLWLCQEQEEQFKEACYRDMMPAILWLGDHDLTKAAPYVERFVEKGYVGVAIQTLASDSMRYVMDRQEVGYWEYLLFCRSLPQSLYPSCIKGLTTGVMEFGIPQRAYVLGLAICKSVELKKNERDTCFSEVLRYVANRYPQEISRSICKKIEDAYQQYCKR